MATPTWNRALVTGASSGIGEAFAQALAGTGTEVIAVARRADRLERLASSTGGRVEAMAADLADAEGLAGVEHRLGSTSDPVDLLVNNAGFGTTGAFAELPVEGEDEEIRLNVLALTRLMRATLPGMLERGRGGIVNVASVAAFSPAPRSATYAATKAFVLSLSESVAEEVRSKGVRVQALCPGLTRTEFQDVASYDASKAPDFLWQTSEEVVAESLTGLDRGRVVVVPGAHNKAFTLSTAAMPRALKRRVAGIVQSRR